MRVLFATGSPPDYMAPPRLAEAQVNCGPAWRDERAPDGRVLSLATPVGEYDLAAVAARLPRAQQPDLVVCLVDASWRNLPRNLGAFKVPRVLLIADTHHMHSPLLGMMRYAISEPFSRRVVVYDRHHAVLFRSAGIRDLFWFPGLTFPHDDATVQAARSAGREPRLAFVGQAGGFHPRRARLLRALEERGVDIRVESLPQSRALECYGQSLFGFNASLNGDLNLRAFEILASGAALLTDRLGAGSGLEKLWREGQEFIAYASEAELGDLAEDWLERPAEARMIGQAGAKWFDEHLGSARRRDLFRRLAFDGVAAPEFAFTEEETRRVLFGGSLKQLLPAVQAYEQVQDWHRTQERVEIAASPTVPEDIEGVLASLPRVHLRRWKEGAIGKAADLAIVAAAELAAAAESRVARIWAWDVAGAEALAGELAVTAAGYVRGERGGAWWMRPRVPAARAGAEDRRAGPHVLVFTDDPDSGGVAQYNHSLLTGLVEAGLTVSCAQSRCDSPLVAKQRELGVRHWWIPYDTRREFAKTLSDQVNAARIFEEARPDLVVFSNCCPLSNLAAREIARRDGLPYLVVEGFVGAYLAERFAPLLGALGVQYAQARAVVAVSQENLELLHRHFRLPAGQGQVIHYGRPERYFAPVNPAERARRRAELGLAEGDVLSFTAARLDPVKGHRYQLAALQRLAAERGGRRLHLAWAGEGPERGELEKWIRAAGLGPRVHLIGQRWDVAEWYEAADLFTLPSELEGMPLAIMEAMAKGLPVVATAVSGIPEEMGDTGCLLPGAATERPALIEKLARTWLAWVREPATRQRVGAAARRRAEEMFREVRMVERTVGLIRQHLPHGQAGQPEGAAVARSA
ncbi:MAG: glycosyltransferase [Verrucomicrobia bacterium]|nr:glycosyltransferase [Verrucomicrobiota bacterium]